jgi:hypothetical protein
MEIDANKNIYECYLCEYISHVTVLALFLE